MINLSTEELDRLYEGSKNDHYIVVGSEVRQMIGMIRRSADRIEQLEAALREIDNIAPATCEVTLAHQMADIARTALDQSSPPEASD